ncbi:3-oxoacyl-[acyl-carrier protein] reductase [Paraburkholderia caribensis MBA4]|uniref:3-oxoacyl-[acyl-carrier protein] reductase n=1 Tax=Paraburkholderia caribensis MBA4 TaxID=1323664 RepID=A0A0N7JV81_9BURK|nr:SDR family oxidoreductase [Paraburkholderia caribensis]ALL68477.1 3-oxoacyl-[acyl-carrier protein] reductase [Paraburkholderia caribensis MBA4]
MEFEGTSVAIIGAHSGTGPAVVKAFVEKGARVTVGTLANSKGSKPALPGTIEVEVNTSDVESISRFFDKVEAEQGAVDVLVNVAPPIASGNALDFTPEEYRQVVEQELIGPILSMQEAARRMVPRGFGRIMSFISMSGKTGVHKHVAPFAAAKGGLVTFSRTLAAELAPTGVTVNTLATALFDVQVASMPDGSEVVKGIPVGRPGRSEEAAHAVLFLASKDAGYVTGETLNLSGGRFMD